MRGVSDREERKGQPTQHAAPAPRAEQGGGQAARQDEVERDTHDEVAHFDDRGAHHPENHRRRDGDRHEHEQPVLVALAPGDAPRRDPDRRCAREGGPGEPCCNGKTQRVSDRTAREQGPVQRVAASDAEHAEVDPEERGDGEEGRRVERREHQCGAQRRLPAPGEASGREREGAGDVEEEREVREDSEDQTGADRGSDRGARTSLRAIQQPAGGQRKKDRQRVAARLGREVDQGEAEPHQDRREQRLQPAVAAPQGTGERNARDPGQERRNPVEDEVLALADPVEEERVQVVIVRMVDSVEDLPGPAHGLDQVVGPDLVQPEVPEGGDDPQRRRREQDCRAAEGEAAIGQRRPWGCVRRHRGASQTAFEAGSWIPRGRIPAASGITECRVMR